MKGHQKFKFSCEHEDRCLDLVCGKLDNQNLNLFFNLDLPSVYLFRASSDALHDDGIYEGDYIVCNRALLVEDQSIIIIAVDGKFYIRRFNDGQKPYLSASNPKFKDIDLTKAKEVEFFGVVTGVIRKYKNIIKNRN